MRLLGILLLSIASIAVFVGVVLPAATTRILGFGIDIPKGWGRSAAFILLSHPWLSLASGLFLLAVFGSGIWRLAH